MSFNKQIIIGLILCLTLVNCDFTFKENLNVENVRDPSKMLFSFQFDFGFPLDFNNLDSQVYTFSRSVLENIFVNSGSTHTRVETACGTVNPLYLTEKNIEENYFFPTNGMKIFANSESNFQILIESLGEIFKLTKNNVRKSNHYLVKNDLIQSQNIEKENLFQGDYIYAQDPTDFICTNNIEKLKKYFPCGGNKGLLSIIDQTLLFKADYISIESDFKYSKNKKFVNIQFTINTIVPKLDYQSYFVLNNKQQCPLSSQTTIKIGEQTINNIKNISDINLEELTNQIANNKESRKNVEGIFNHKPMIQSQRYMGDRWFDFDGNLVHEITNNSSDKIANIITTEYLIWQFQPIMHKMKMIRNDKDEVKDVNYTLDINEGSSYKLQFNFELKPLEKVRIIIPMHKIMKSFENYPHDPQRGHDLISASLIYNIQGDLSQNIKHVKTEALVVRLPEPDFSMPFNIMTYVCVLVGYVFLTIFLYSSTKPK